MKKTVLIVACSSVCLLAVLGYSYLSRRGGSTVENSKDSVSPPVSNFVQCVDAGGTVQTMSRPRVCTLSTGESFSDEADPAASGEAEEATGADRPRCVPSGCSSQLCAEEKDAGSLMTTCEYRAEYGCYRTAVCERQKDGRCGWTMTQALSECLKDVSKDLDGSYDTTIHASSEQASPPKDRATEGEEPLPPTKDVSRRVSLISWGFKKTPSRDIDTIILHSSYNSLGGDKFDADAIIAIYKQYEVSAHYIVGRDGGITQLVKEADIAYHAGVSSLPDGRTDVNGVSIGIEMVGDESSGFTDEQYDAVNELIADIKGRHKIKYVLGHDDIAPGRKTDPWALDWKKVKK